jgi:ATP-binding cassette subfamily F protein uup
MSQIHLKNISIAFGADPLLDKVDLIIEAKERLCILGRNGTGKSTLLKLINGEIKPDGGEISYQSGITIAKLDQDVPSNMSGTVYKVITQGLGKLGQLLAQYQDLTHKLADDSSEQILNELHTVQQALDKEHGWDLSYKIESIISLLALPADMEFSSLSGGLKRRVLLGQALVKDPDIILLDEPTNHLEIEAIDWLEKFLKGFAGTVIFITHDRTFMQSIATRMVELDRGKLSSYPGNYQQYLDRKQHELEVEQTQNREFDKKLKQEEAWIRQGVKARRTRNEGRVRALESLRAVRQSRREQIGTAKLQIQKSEQSGKIVIEAKNISFNYPDKMIANDFSTTIIRGDKIGLIGPNGVGKTTLLRILLGQLQPQQGSVRHGTKLEIAYFDQLRADLDESKTVADNISYGDQYVTVNGQLIHIMTYLQDFLFSPQRARSPVSSLSGGERNRLLLARLFTKAANLLVLDEPTNDLDLETLELLESLLVDYTGTLLLVSHDRSFLDNTVTSTMVFNGDGKIEEFVGGYDDWLHQKKMVTENEKVAATKPQTTNEDYQTRKEMAALERKIEKCEAKQKELKHKLTDPELYLPEQSQQLEKLQQQLQQCETELAELVGKWERFV